MNSVKKLVEDINALPEGSEDGMAQEMNAKLPLVGIVVVNYQNLEDSLRCLESLKNLEYPNAFIILVDSASPNQSGYKLRDQFAGAGVEVIITPDNGGFAASNNVGIKRARALGAEYVWLLNADTTVESNALSELVKGAQSQPAAAAWGSKILYAEDESGSQTATKKRIWSAGGLVNFKDQSVEMRGCQQPDEGQWDDEASCDYLPGCSILVSCSVLDKVGYMPEHYFMYFEETDWCNQIKREGMELGYLPKSVVYHHFEDQKTQSAFNVYYYNRNNLMFWFRVGNLRQKISLILFGLKRLPRVISDFFRAENEHQKEIFRAHMLSTIDFLALRSGKRYQF